MLLACLFSLGGESADVDYARDVRPLLADRCFACHGPDEESRQPRSAPLRLDQGSDASVGTELMQRVRSIEPGERMPPIEAGVALSVAEQELLADWVAAGMPRTEHWAYAPVERPAPPESGHPGRATGA